MSRRTRPDSNTKQVLGIYGRKCFYCRGKAKTVDHIIPISRNGSNTLANKRPACSTCNKLKSNLSIEQFVIFYPDRIHPNFVMIAGEAKADYGGEHIIGRGDGYINVTGTCLHCGNDFEKFVHHNDVRTFKFCKKNCKKNHGKVARRKRKEASYEQGDFNGGRTSIWEVNLGS